MSREILVVKREILFPGGAPQGFVEETGQGYIKTVLEKYEYKERNDALEHDTSFKQIIPYVWIVNPNLKKVFLYKRAPSTNPHYKEQRYLNKFAGGVGGHIDKDTEEKTQDPIHAAMMRELREEVALDEYPIPKIVGYVNDDEDDLGSVHFGVVALAATSQEQIVVTDGGSFGAFYSSDEIDNFFANPENKIETWTTLSWPFVKKYLLSL